MLRSITILTAIGALAWNSVALAQNSAETEHLVVQDFSRQLSGKSLQDFADKADQALMKSVQFWGIPGPGYGKIRMELYPQQGLHAFSVFQQTRIRGGGTQRIVRVYGLESPQEMVHKLTHALFPTEDKLIRNMMGIPTEARFGNPLSFPMCGRPLDSWVAAIRRAGSYLPLAELGERHEDWGMTFTGQKPIITDRKRQHASYMEAGSFGEWLINTQGIDNVRAFHRAAQEGGRPWKMIFGKDLAALETEWGQSIDKHGQASLAEVETLARLWKKDPTTACDAALGTSPKVRRTGQKSGGRRFSR
jgi:hypothetical protein